jgi:hypothetical protein
MNSKRVAALLLLSAGIAFAAGSARGQSPEVGTEIRRIVAHDSETQIGYQVNLKYYQGDTLCMARFIPSLELVTPPTHGTVRFDTADVVPRGTGCSNSVAGTVVLYRPTPGFVGQDRFAYKLQADPMAMDRVGGNTLMRYVTVVVR